MILYVSCVQSGDRSAYCMRRLFTGPLFTGRLFTRPLKAPHRSKPSVHADGRRRKPASQSLYSLFPVHRVSVPHPSVIPPVQDPLWLCSLHCVLSSLVQMLRNIQHHHITHTPSPSSPSQSPLPHPHTPLSLNSPYLPSPPHRQTAVSRSSEV